jgi:hypothetical protein
MAKKHMIKCSPPMATEMQIKTMLRIDLTPVRIATIKNTTTTNVGEDVGRKRNPHALLVGMQASTTTLENNMEAS